MLSGSRLIQLASVAAAALSLGLTGSAAQASDSVAIGNPSFEMLNATGNGFPGYGPIPDWTNTTSDSGYNETIAGLNASTAFSNNVAPLDGGYVALLQNSGNGTPSISQTISNLNTAYQYWLQIWANARQSNTADMTVTYGSQTLTEVTNISGGNASATAPWVFVNVPFTPSTSSGTLTITNPLTGGDNTLLLDSVSVIQRNPGQIVIANPSFEGSQLTSYPGYYTPLAGWTESTGNVGINTVGDAFANNGAVPDGSNVAFLQNNSSNLSTASVFTPSSITQSLSGLTTGTTYQLKFYYNARSGGSASSTDPIMQVQLGGQTLTQTGGITVNPVGTGANGFTTPYDLFTANYTATGTTADLVISNIQSVTGAANDSTLLLDNVSLGTVPEPASLALLGLSASGLLLLKRRRTV